MENLGNLGKLGILIFVYLFLIGGIVTIYSHKNLNRVYVSLVLFFLFKLIFNYRKCTISYLECKFRNVKKEQGYLWRFIDEIIKLRDSIDIIPIYLMAVIITVEYFFFKNNKLFI